MRTTRHTALVILLLIAMTVGVGADGNDEPTPTPDATEEVGAVITEEATEEAATTDEAAPVNDDGTCRYSWFFNVPQPEVCPAENVVTSEAAFQRFEYGAMLWTEGDDNIMVMFDTQGNTRWLEAPDEYVPGAPERDNAWAEPQPPQSVQPRYGFGVLWRTDDRLRRRIGWASQNWEFVYEAGKQTAVDGTIYVSDPNGSIYELLPEGADWRLYR
jgi:hypothetical protein